MEIVDSMGVDNCRIEEDIRVLVLIKESNRIVETTQRGVGALKLEVENLVTMEIVAVKKGVDLMKVMYGFGFVY